MKDIIRDGVTTKKPLWNNGVRRNNSTSLEKNWLETYTFFDLETYPRCYETHRSYEA